MAMTSGIWASAAKEMGLSVSTDMPKEVLEMMSLYPQPMRQHGGVEYLPVPRHREPAPARTMIG